MTKQTGKCTDWGRFRSLFVPVMLTGCLVLSACSAEKPASTSETAGQTWEIADQSEQTATLTVDSSGRFTGSGWSGGGSAGIPPYDIPITNGKMSGTSMSFDMSASYNNGAGSISGSATGKLNASFPNAASASGTMSGRISDPLGTRSFNSTWTARRISGEGVFTSAEDFDFDVDVNPHSVSIMQGEAATITVTVKLVRGEPQPVLLTTTDWSSAEGISVRFDRTTVTPTGTTRLFVKTTCNTPADNYLFTVRGESGGTFRTSADAVTVAVKENPDCASSETARQHNERGLAYLDNGQLDNAIVEFNQAIWLDADYAPAYNNRGLAYYRKGEYDHAIADYAEAIELDPNRAFVYNNRGLAYYRKGEYDHAIADYSRAIELDPDYAQAYNNRGLAYQEGKDEYDRAITDATTTIALDPGLASAYNNRGFAHYSKGDYDQAIADFERAIELSDDASLTQEAEQALEELRS